MGGSYLSTCWGEKITGHQIDTVGTQNTGQNGLLTLIFEIFSNRALFRK